MKSIKQKTYFIHSAHFTDIHIMYSSEFLVSKKIVHKFPDYGGKGREAKDNRIVYWFIPRVRCERRDKKY